MPWQMTLIHNLSIIFFLSLLSMAFPVDTCPSLSPLITWPNDHDCLFLIIVISCLCLSFCQNMLMTHFDCPSSAENNRTLSTPWVSAAQGAGTHIFVNSTALGGGCGHYHTSRFYFLMTPFLVSISCWVDP